MSTMVSLTEFVRRPGKYIQIRGLFDSFYRISFYKNDILLTLSLFNSLKGFQCVRRFLCRFQFGVTQTMRSTTC